MTKSIEIRALEALVNELDEKISALNLRAEEKWDEHLIENTRITTLIAVLQKAFPKSARMIIHNTIEELKLKGDNECDLLEYYDDSYGE
jgi:hypothetical protein